MRCFTSAFLAEQVASASQSRVIFSCFITDGFPGFEIRGRIEGIAGWFRHVGDTRMRTRKILLDKVPQWGASLASEIDALGVSGGRIVDNPLGTNLVALHSQPTPTLLRPLLARLLLPSRPAGQLESFANSLAVQDHLQFTWRDSQSETFFGPSYLHKKSSVRSVPTSVCSPATTLPL